MLKMATVRKLLEISDVTQAPYAVAEGAAALLMTSATDLVALGQYVRALTTLELGAAARQVLGTAAERLPEHKATYDSLAAHLAGIPLGVVPWASRRRRFQANVRALSVRWPELASLPEVWEPRASGYELHQSANGNYHVLATNTPNVWDAWLGGFEDQRATAEIWQFDSRAQPTPAPMAFDGLGYGWLFQRVFTTTQRSFLQYSFALYVAETDPVAFCMLLHMHDLQAMLTDPRVRLYVGPDALDRMAADARRNENDSLPQNFVVDRLTPAEPNRLQQIGDLLLEERQKQRRAAWEQVAQYYADKDTAYWQRRYAEAASGGPPLRVLGLTTRFSTVLRYSMEEVAAAVRAAGHMMEIVSEAHDHTLENRLAWHIAEFRPDLIFQISRMRYEFPDLPKQVPFLCWDQDNLPGMRSPGASASLDALTYVAGHGAFHGYAYLNWPRENCIFCQLAAAAHRYAPRELTAEEVQRYACDVSYVSNASGDPRKLLEELLSLFAQVQQGQMLLRGVSERIIDDQARPMPLNSHDVYRLLDEVQRELHIDAPPRLREEVVMYAITVADRCFRHAGLLWTSQWCQAHGKTLRLYGSGWEQHPLLSQHAAGPARQGEELRCIYQASRINLQIIETGFLHSRALDGLAAGGFFLARRTPYDGIDAPDLASQLAVARWARDQHMTSFAQIEQAEDPEIRRHWARLCDRVYPGGAAAIYRPEAAFKGLCILPEMPVAAQVFPDFTAISFDSEDTCGALLDKYLGDESLRRATAERMREAVIREFSYDARWKMFLKGITDGLARGCQPASAGSCGS